MKTSVYLCFLLILLFSGCHPADEEMFHFTGGVFIVNEGKFNSNTGSISHYDPSSGKMIGDVFMQANGRPLGDVVQSMAITGDTGVIVVNNSQKIEMVNLRTFVSIGSVTGIDYPRHFLPLGDGTGLLTAGSFGGSVYRIDLKTLRVTDTLAVGNGPETLVRMNNRVYVVNSGGWTIDSTVSVIDLDTFSIIDTIPVGDQPADIVCAGNYLWVLCSGRVLYNNDWSQVIYESDAQITRISFSDHTTTSMIIGQKGDGYNPRRLALGSDGSTLFFDEAGGVYRVEADLTTAPEGPVIRKRVYGLETNRYGELYTFIAPGFDMNGYMLRYNMNGMLVDSATVGIAPNGAVSWD